jgi:hypothetical protein
MTMKDQGDHIEFKYQIKDETYQIFFRSNGTKLIGSSEAYLISSLLPCMRVGQSKVTIADEISETLLSALPKIQDIYLAWDPSLCRIKLENAKPTNRNLTSQNRVGSFFSGGMDSFYTFLKHHEEITDLIFVHGLDIKLTDKSLRERTASKIREVALSFGKNVIEIETNVRSLLNPYADWGKLAHGAALAAIGHLLYQDFCRIFIPATHTYADLFPWGSHPVLDHLWSSETLTFIHDGCEATRVQKASLISQYDIALKSLRVCWKNPNGSYNCGQCEKCLRTMINLEVNGALSRCTTFENELDLKEVSRINISDDNTRAFVRENYEALLENNQYQNEKLRKALKKTLDRPQWSAKINRHLKMTHKTIGKLLAYLP